MVATDGKKYLTDAGDIETILRIVQIVPSKKAEPIKLWLAKVGYERMQEISEELNSNQKQVNQSLLVRIFYE